MHNLKGTGRLVRLALRRDRIKLPVALLSFGALIPALISGVSEIFEGDTELAQGVAFLSVNPVMRLFGLPTGDGFGNLFMLRGFTMLAILVALISTFLVIRHTRQNEEMGRSELVQAGSVGRYSSLTAALIVAFGANIMIGVLAFIGLMSIDVSIGGGLPAEGALLMAVAIAMVGISFSCVAAVCAQLTQTSRSANGISASLVSFAFFMSGLGSLLGQLRSSSVEVDAAWMTWLSPIGWAQLLEPFASENWWMLSVFAGFIIASIATAILLQSKRDDGRGIFNARRGPAAAKPYLLRAPGLVWRLNRGMFLSWWIGVGFLAVIYGMVGADVEELLGEAEGIAELFVAMTGSEDIILAYLGSIISILAIFVLAYAVQATLRLRTEEARSLEFLLATTLGRLRWLLTHLGFVIISTTVMIISAGVIAGIAAEMVLEDIDNLIWSQTAGALTQLPALLLIIGLVVLVFGLAPRAVNAIAWTTVAISIILGPFFGSLLGVPERLLDVSPFTHLPSVPPVDNIEAAPLIILLVAALSLLTVGIYLFKRRNIVPN